MIEIEGVSKFYGGRRVLDDLSFTVEPGKVTGFLGPNGSGKSTTMRIILGLDAPGAGSARIEGRPYREHEAPLRTAGALLEARAAAPGRTARAHLLALGATHGIGCRRVEEVLAMVGLESVATRRSGSFSLGMAQRLGIAAALLGDPGVLLLDEPINGLDPDGVRWVRELLRGLAADGRTVFVSSHLMGEMAVTADHLVVIGAGRLLADCSVKELTRSVSGSEGATLEDAFFELTRDATEFDAGAVQR
jgi:ABC-2 type transport system ATP-binding protein